MELRQLHYFLALARNLHFNRAAEQLHIVQPALTKQIKDLEADLGVQLFERTKRRVALTPAGTYLQTEVEGIFAKLTELRNRVQWVADGTKGEVRMGYVGSCIHTFLPEVLTRLTTQYPSIQTYLNEMTSSSQLAAIERGELDIAFLRNPPDLFFIEHQLVFSETFSLVVPPQHWATDEVATNLHQLANEAFILPTKPDGAMYQELQLSICSDAGFVPQIAHESVHGHTVLQLVQQGLGVAFLPTSFRNVTHTKARFIELAHIRQRSEITAVWHKTNPNPSLKRLLGLL